MRSIEASEPDVDYFIDGSISPLVRSSALRTGVWKRQTYLRSGGRILTYTLYIKA